MCPTNADTTTDRWQLYDQLIAGIPDGITVTRALANRWALVDTDQHTMGMAMVYSGGRPAPPDQWQLVGRELREVASLVKSWDLKLASIGTAALNAWYSTPQRLAELPGVQIGDDTNYFTHRAQILGTRPTAIVGHFPNVESLQGDITVLERNPRGDDLPDAASEYVLADCQLVAITGSTLTNKTLPRLLELSAHAEVHLIGPSAPAAGVYPACVREIAGSYIVDPEACWYYAGLGLRRLVGSDAVQAYSITLGSGTPDTAAEDSSR